MINLLLMTRFKWIQQMRLKNMCPIFHIGYTDARVFPEILPDNQQHFIASKMNHKENSVYFMWNILLSKN